MFLILKVGWCPTDVQIYELDIALRRVLARPLVFLDGVRSRSPRVRVLLILMLVFLKIISRCRTLARGAIPSLREVLGLLLRASLKVGRKGARYRRQPCRILL